MIDANEVEYQECVVGNIVGNHYWGEHKELRNGTKHFRAGTKVYCVFMYGGMGHESVRVLGKPRKSFRMVDVVIRTSYIKNFRRQKVYLPRVLKFLDKYPYLHNVDEVEKHLIDQLNESHVEIKL